MKARGLLNWLVLAVASAWLCADCRADDAADFALIERDWRMQDGIDTTRMPLSYSEAIAQTLRRGDALIDDLSAGGVPLGKMTKGWEQLRLEFQKLSADTATNDQASETLWREVHTLRRKIALSNPLARTGPLVFVKQMPSALSHQLTQYYGRAARGAWQHR